MTITHSKRCFKCKEVKNISEFYAHPKMQDGTVNKCKSCNKKDVRLNREVNLDHYREYDKARNLEINRKTKHKKHQEDYEDKYPNRKDANTTIAKAIKSGLVKRLTFCESCWCICKPDAHHISYSKDMWLNVIWLCKSCHSKLHLHFKFKI